MSLRARGVTLIELVVTIVILGIVSVAFGMFIVPAIRAHQAMVQRAALVDATEVALRRMARDIHISLPNSLRVSPTAGGFALELVPTIDGARYCAAGVANCTVAAQQLVFAAGDNNFDVLGCFQNATFVPNNAFRLVVNPGTTVYTATTAASILTPSTTTLTLTTVNGGGAGVGTCGNSSGGNFSYRHHLALSANQTFPNPPSPRGRLFVLRDADVPVTYICDANAGTLRRYAGYKMGGAGTAYSSATQPTDPGVAPLSNATSVGLVANGVTACSAISTIQVLTKGLMIMTLALTAAGETVQLMHQVQVDNSP